MQSPEEVTLVGNAIHNPDEPRHFMRIKPVDRVVEVEAGGQVIARSADAVRVIEAGRDLYDPVLYIPRGDVSALMEQVDGKTTHCPIKGDASYWTLDGEEIAWSYDKPLDMARELGGRIAFDGSKVTVIERPA